MSSAIILYGVLAVAMLRGALEIHEIMAHRASRRRLEQELHLILTLMLAAALPETVTAAQNPDSTASMLADRPQDSRSATVAAVRRTRRMR